jgi:hypothetical protein
MKHLEISNSPKGWLSRKGRCRWSTPWRHLAVPADRGLSAPLTAIAYRAARYSMLHRSPRGDHPAATSWMIFHQFQPYSMISAGAGIESPRPLTRRLLS